MLSMFELKRLTRPFASETDEEEAFHYWSNRTPEEKIAESTRLTIEHYRELGVDVNKPMDKTLIRRTILEKKMEGN